MNRNHIIQGLAIIVFICGFILLSFVAWWYNSLASMDAGDIMWESTRKGVVATGAWLMIGIALVTVAMIVTLVVKVQKE
jgi:hypothetical protein